MIPKSGNRFSEKDHAQTKETGDAGRYSRSFGLSASVCIAALDGEWKAYCVTAAIARNSKQEGKIKKAQGCMSGLGLPWGSLLLPRADLCRSGSRGRHGLFFPAGPD